MRISVNPDSPFFDASFPSVDPYLNGRLIMGVVEASEGEGWVDILDADDAGRVIRTGDELQLRRLHGHVELQRDSR
jgi:hypothetical protein